MNHLQANALHAFSKGAVFGLVVAGQILYVTYVSVLQYPYVANVAPMF